MNTLTLLLGALLLFPAALTSTAPVDELASIREQLPSYPLETCPLTGEKLDENAKSLIVEGTLVRVCCAKCVKGVKASPTAAVAMVKRAVIAQQLASYPLKTCVVSGEPLGEKPVDMVIGTRLVRVCCTDCVKVVNKDSSKHMATIDAALIRSQIEAYPSKACPVSGEALGSMGDPINRLYGTKLVRLCCKGCLKSYEKNPAKFAEQIYGTKKATSQPTEKKPTSRKTN